MRIQHRMIMGLLAALIIIGAPIRDDAVAAPAAKDCNPGNFLESVWQDLLQREITHDEKKSMLDFLKSGGSHAQVAQILLNSAEYRARFTQSLFQQFLDRAATKTESDFFLNALRQGAIVEQLIAVIAGSNEYYQNRGGGTNNGFLEQLYKDLLGRPIDKSELAFGADFLNRGGARSQVAQIILGSAEYRSAQIQGFFETFLERKASDSEVNVFLALWQRGARREQIIARIIGSPEYCELARRKRHNHQPKI
ncbi:MAG: DUF4214 domain-containing protein [Acidobacteria bacterium]|nr:DUF4214 domain-containing protein [Acidobacteriota bacterium]